MSAPLTAAELCDLYPTRGFLRHAKHGLLQEQLERAGTLDIT